MESKALQQVAVRGRKDWLSRTKRLQLSKDIWHTVSYQRAHGYVGGCRLAREGGVYLSRFPLERYLVARPLSQLSSDDTPSIRLSMSCPPAFRVVLGPARQGPGYRYSYRITKIGTYLPYLGTSTKYLLTSQPRAIGPDLEALAREVLFCREVSPHLL